MNISRSRLALLAVASVVLMGASCQRAADVSNPPAAAPGTETGTDDTAPAAPAAGTDVTIQNLAFGPTTITVSAGDTVTWANQDSAPHTVTADDGSFDSGTLSQGGTFSQTFTTPGTYTYHCEIHPRMTATVVVQ